MRVWYLVAALAGAAIYVSCGGSNSSSTSTNSGVQQRAVGVFAATGDLVQSRLLNAATALGNGKVLIAGGVDANANPLSSAELYDPVSGSFAATGVLGSAAPLPSSILLNNGRVLVVEGPSNSTLGNAAELYDPVTGTFSATGAMNGLYVQAELSKLNDGRILATGATPNSSSLSTFTGMGEIFDPATGTFASAGQMTTARFFYSQTTLPDGRVLIAGGLDMNATSGVTNPTNAPTLNTVEIFDPRTNTFTAAGTFAGGGRVGHTATLLNNGKVLIAGGVCGSNAVCDSELFDPQMNTFTKTGDLVPPATPGLYLAALLQNGDVLVGAQNFQVYKVATGQFISVGPVDTHPAATFSTATSLSNDDVLFTGGFYPATSASPSAPALTLIGHGVLYEP